MKLMEVGLNKEFMPSLIQDAYGNMTGPLTVMLDVTNKCNLNCLHCYNRSGKDCKYTDMNDEEMIGQIDYIIKLAPRILCFCGGEPLLRHNLLRKMASKLSEAGILVNMVTNGVLLNKQMLQDLRNSGVQEFQISLDSHKRNVHDYFRGSQGAYEGATRAIKLLLSSGIIPSVSFIPTKINYKDIVGVVDLLYSLGIKKLGSMPYIPIGRGLDNIGELLMQDDDLLDFYILLAKVKSQYKDFKIEYEDPLEHITLFLNNSVAKTMLVEVRSNGDVLISSYIPVVWGNIKKNNIYAMWNEGLKDAWRYKQVVEIANKIKTLKDLTQSILKPWNKEDIKINE